MARLKKTSVVLDTERKRLGLKWITPAADFGSQLTIPIYERKIAGFAGKPDAGFDTLLHGYLELSVA